MDLFAHAFELIGAGAGVSELAWEIGSRCDCQINARSKQPQWTCPDCGGLGAVYTAPVTIKAIFRAQSRWTSKHMSGEHSLGDAQLSTLSIDERPGYTDARVRDRFTVLVSPTDPARGRIFYPATQAVPFLIGNVQRGWRVQLQSLEQATRTVPQP